MGNSLACVPRPMPISSSGHDHHTDEKSNAVPHFSLKTIQRPVWLNEALNASMLWEQFTTLLNTGLCERSK